MSLRRNVGSDVDDLNVVGRCKVGRPTQLIIIYLADGFPRQSVALSNKLDKYVIIHM